MENMSCFKLEIFGHGVLLCALASFLFSTGSSRSEKERERSISFSQLSLSQTKPAHFCFILVSLRKKRWKMIVNGTYLKYDVYMLLLKNWPTREASLLVKALISMPVLGSFLLSSCVRLVQLEQVNLCWSFSSSAVTWKSTKLLYTFALVSTETVANWWGKWSFLPATTINAYFQNLYHKALLSQRWGRFWPSFCTSTYILVYFTKYSAG